MRKKRVVIDTSCWFSFLTGKRLSALASLLSEGRVDIVLSEELIGEIAEVASLPKFAVAFPASEVERLISFLRLQSVMVEPDREVEICGETADDHLLSLAKSSKARLLVTDDKALLSIGRFGTCRIVDATTFDFISLLSKF